MRTISLLSVDEARERILSQFHPVKTETLPLADSLNRVLARDVRAADDLPLFDNSSMDGFALRAADVTGAAPDSPRSLRVVADIPAGFSATVILSAGEAARIMTGAPMLQRFEIRISQLRLDSIARAAFGFMQQLLRLPYVSLSICVPDGEERQLLTFSEEGGVATESFSSADPADLIEPALTRGEMVYHMDLSAETHAGDIFVHGLRADIRSLAILPLRTRDAVSGTLNVGSDRTDGIPSHQREFLAPAATGLAAALRSAQRLEKLESECERLRKECDFQKSALKKSHVPQSLTRPQAASIASPASIRLSN